MQVEMKDKISNCDIFVNFTSFKSQCVFLNFVEINNVCYKL